MLKAPITYTDFDDNEVTETLYFNISKTELADNLHLQARFESILKKVEGPARDLTMAEIQEILDLVKTVMKLAYGVRSEDGKRFRKSAELWQDFQDTAAYDAYLYSLFVNPEQANDFLLGVLPKDLRAAAEQEASKTLETPARGDVEELSPEDKALLEMDPQKMSKEQMQRAMAIRFGG